MGCRFYIPTKTEWEEIGASLPPAQRSTRTDSQLVFVTMLHVLWYQLPVRSAAPPRFCSANVMSGLLWTWAESGALGHVWSDYLQRNTDLQIRHWAMVFQFYESSWRFRREALKHAGKVHTLWFRQLATFLKQEVSRRDLRWPTTP